MSYKGKSIKFLISCLIILSGAGLHGASGHIIRVVSICFNQGSKSVEAICRLIDKEAEAGVDLICLPEAWTGYHPESVEGNTIKQIAGLAKKHHTYIVCPLILKRKGSVFNTSILIARDGTISGIYDKIFPYWSELEGEYPVQPGQNDAAVFETDFGKIGLAICYDAKFPEVFKRLCNRQADLVVWSSAYSGFTELQAYATLNHYYIVTSTWTGDCLVYDINGQNLLDMNEKKDITIARYELDMDRQIYHYNFNQDKLKKLLSEHGDEVSVDIDMPREEWFVLKSKNVQFSSRQLARQYGLEPLRMYIERSREHIDTLRGFDFNQKYNGNP